MKRPHVLVVGGGVVGVSCAYALARRGARVTVAERAELAAGASHGNAGTIAPGHPPLNRPGRVRSALGQMIDSTSPLYIRPRWDPALWGWLRTFARHCTEEHVAASMRVLAPLGRDALAEFDLIMEEEELDCGYRKEGYYQICLTEDGLAEAREEAGLVERHGYAPEVLTPEDLRAREPALSPGVAGGVFYPEAAALDPLAFVHELADRARARRTTIREGVEVREILVASGQAVGARTATGEALIADAVVLATGPYSSGLLRRFGLQLPVQPGKGYHRDLPLGDGGAPPLRISCVVSETSVYCTPMGDRLRLAGTVEFSGLNDVMRRPRLEQLTNAARLAFPALGSAQPLSEWCGLRPMSADGLPIVGEVPGVGGLMVATGHGKLGLTLGPITGKMVADRLFEPGAEHPYGELGPERFTS